MQTAGVILSSVDTLIGLFIAVALIRYMRRHNGR